MDKTIGFIGTGNMAGAMIAGMVKSGIVQPDQILASNRTKEKAAELANVHGIQAIESNKEVAERSDYLFLATTPDKYKEVIEEAGDSVHKNTVIIHIAAGMTLKDVEGLFNRKVKVVKAMPNTPVQVGEGMTSICVNKMVGMEEVREVKALFESFGKAEIIDENIMDIASAVGGSSPAFGYMFIEALADSAVLHGMPRQQAYKITSQAILGAAKMIQETGKHPGELKDEVCSPNGTTIQSVASLEEHGLRNAVIQAVNDNMKKMEK